MSDVLRIGLPKGRVLAETCSLFREAGLDLGDLEKPTRRLIHEVETPHFGRFEVLILRAKDVPAYVEHGVCAFGVAGYDTLVEQRPNVLQPLDLAFGRCRVAIAHRVGIDPWRIEKPRIATKFPRIAGDYFLSRGTPAQIVELSGAIEIAPLVGLADAIVDIVETGETLRKNGLTEGETIFDVSARLIFNRASLRLHMARLRAIQDALVEALAVRTPTPTPTPTSARTNAPMSAP